MSIECARSSSPVNIWLHHTRLPTQPSRAATSAVVVGGSGPPTSADSKLMALNRDDEADQALFSSSAPVIGRSSSIHQLGDPSMVGFFSDLSCRRAASFPMTHNATLPSLKVRSQSESTALNTISIKVPRNLFHELEMCRHKFQSGIGGGVSGGGVIGCPTPCCSPAGISFYVPVQEDAIQSDSEGDDSLVSSSDDSSTTECVSGGGASIGQFQTDMDADLGVELELDDVDAMNEQRLINSAVFSQRLDCVESGASSSSALSTSSSMSSSSSTLKSEDCCVTTATTGSEDHQTNDNSITTQSSREQATDGVVNRLASLLMSTALQRVASTANATASLDNTPVSEKVSTTDVLARSKAVRFADECGKRLEVVRVMTEPSDYPPLINPAVIRRYRKAAAASLGPKSGNGVSSSSAMNDDDYDDDEDSDDSSKPLRSTWKIIFKQPASEYVKFRETLKHQKVALENVMLKNEVGRMVGTIKVANIAFEKRVFIRFTTDNWQSYVDRNAIYQSSPSKTYDTFRFDIEIPRDTDSSSRVEFCVCFVAGINECADEHWDSNNGNNYVLVGSSLEHSSVLTPSPKSTETSAKPAASNETLSGISNGGIGHLASWMSDDAYRMDYSNWTKFASWKNLKTDVPYW